MEIVEMIPGKVMEETRIDPKTGAELVTQWRDITMVYEDGSKRTFSHNEPEVRRDELGK